MVSKSVLFTIVSTLIATSSAAPIHFRRDVTVKSGDTCSAIAAGNGVSVGDLLAANPAVNAGCTNLAVGQVLKVGGASGGNTGGGARPQAPGAGDVTPAAIVAVAPNAASCAGSTEASCRTADQAAPFINQAFAKFGIDSKGEKAALLSLMAFETGGFVFDINKFPGRPGQGTRNLMMFPFILKYAFETPEVAPKVAQVAPGVTANTDPNSVAPDTQNAIRALVLGDDLSFASASWFLKTKCDARFSSDLKSGTQASYESYLTGCIGTTVTPERIAGFQKAIAALN
jgi:LysM repeat protein